MIVNTTVFSSNPHFSPRTTLGVSIWHSKQRLFSFPLLAWCQWLESYLVVNLMIRSISTAYQILEHHISSSLTLTSRFMRGRLSLQLLNSVVSLVAASVVVTATELTITWNGLTGVSDLDTAGQLIPFLIGLSIMGRVLFLASSDNLGPDPKPIDPYRTLPVTARLPPRSRASHSHHREQRHRRHRRQ